LLAATHGTFAPISSNEASANETSQTAASSFPEAASGGRDAAEVRDDVQTVAEVAEAVRTLLQQGSGVCDPTFADGDHRKRTKQCGLDRGVAERSRPLQVLLVQLSRT